MKKKTYITPTMEVVKLQQPQQILAGSVDPYGVNDNLQGGPVEEGW